MGQSWQKCICWWFDSWPDVCAEWAPAIPEGSHMKPLSTNQSQHLFFSQNSFLRKYTKVSFFQSHQLQSFYRASPHHTKDQSNEIYVQKIAQSLIKLKPRWHCISTLPHRARHLFRWAGFTRSQNLLIFKKLHNCNLMLPYSCPNFEVRWLACSSPGPPCFPF